MNLPQDYVNRMRSQLGEAFPAYLAAMDEPEKRAARVNGLKLSFTYRNFFRDGARESVFQAD